MDKQGQPTLVLLPFSTAKGIHQAHGRLFAVRLRRPTRLLHQAHAQCPLSPERHDQQLSINLERAVKLLHLTPTLVQSSDGRISGEDRYNRYPAGHIDETLE